MRDGKSAKKKERQCETSSGKKEKYLRNWNIEREIERHQALKA